MELDQLASFVRIVESGSLTRAARATRQSLPSVSRHLRALEEELETTLVLRTTRHQTVTPAGRDLYQHALRVLRTVEEARQVGRAGRLRGTLTVSLPITLGQSLVVPRLWPLLQRHPGLSLEVRLEDRLTDLVAEGVDLVVRAGAPLPDSTAFIGAPLLQFRRVLVAAPSWLRGRRAPRTPEALARADCLVQLGAAGPLGRWQLLRADEERQVAVGGSVSASAPLVLLQAALAGAGIALLPSWLVEADLEAGRLVRLLAGWSSPPITAWAMYRQELRHSAAVQAFVAAMKQ